MSCKLIPADKADIARPITWRTPAGWGASHPDQQSGGPEDTANAEAAAQVAALSCGPDGFGFAFGLAARRSLQAAARSAVLELCQIELAQAVVEAEHPTFIDVP